MRSRYRILALILILSLRIFPSFGFAQEISQKGKIHILADHLEFEQRAERLKGQGNVQVNFQGLTFTCEEIDFAIPTGILLAQGDVRLSPDSRYRIESDVLRFDTASRLFSVQNSRIFFEPSYSFTASEIRQISPKEIIITEASYTACDLESPAWRISCSGGMVEVDRSARLKNIVLRVKDRPVFYFPYFWFPINQERAAGFLTPDFGRSSELGYHVGNYFYWPVRDWTDIGFPLDYFEKKGIGTGVEYRYALTESDSGRVRVYGIYDQQKARGRGDLSVQLQQQFTSHTRGVADVTALTDDDYYRDFRREISKRYSQSLPSRVFVETSADPWNGRVLSDFTTFLQEGPNVHYSKAPQIDFSTRLRSYSHLPLFLQWDSSWANLRINDNDQKSLKAQRVDFFPRIFSPLHSGRLLTLTPSLYYRKTCYYQQDGQEGTSSRDLHGAGLDLAGPKLSRSFHDQFNHLVYPRIELTYETMSQDKLDMGSWGNDRQGYLGVDHLDRLEEHRDITFSLINRVWEKEQATEQQQGQGQSRGVRENQGGGAGVAEPGYQPEIRLSHRSVPFLPDRAKG